MAKREKARHYAVDFVHDGAPGAYPFLGTITSGKGRGSCALEAWVVVQATSQRLEADPLVIAYQAVEECSHSSDGAMRVVGAHEDSWVRPR